MKFNKLTLYEKRTKVTAPTVIHNKRARQNKENPALIEHDWYWSLSKYIGRVDHGNWIVQVSTRFPSDSLTEEMTCERVLFLLNTQNCFTFPIALNEGDQLQIVHETRSMSKNKSYWSLDFLSFIYKNEKWHVGSYDPEIDQTLVVQQGSIVVE